MVEEGVKAEQPELAVRWLKRANSTWFAQLDYIALDNPKAAHRMDEALEEELVVLAKHPLMGREGRVAGTRELVISHSPFILVYRIKGKRIDVLNVLHGAQKYPKE